MLINIYSHGPFVLKTGSHVVGLFVFVCLFGLVGLKLRSASCVLGLWVCRCDPPCLVRKVPILNVAQILMCFFSP